MTPVLFARTDSIYKQLIQADVWDKQRDATIYQGTSAVICHPPCRTWGRFRNIRATQLPEEKALAPKAVQLVQANGGVLEHPESSSLWEHCNLPKPTPNQITIDRFGGFTLAIAQHWFGHKARKNTWLYIVGIDPGSIPPFPLVLGEASYVVFVGKRTKPWKRAITKQETEATPLLLAEWLLELCQLIDRKKQLN